MPSAGVPEPHDETTPLTEFEWSDGIVGMGFFPYEVGLPAEWTWTGHEVAHAVRRTAPHRP